MENWQIVALGITLSGIAGSIFGLIYYAMQNKVNDIQRHFNKLENKLFLAMTFHENDDEEACTWLTDLLEHLVVGDWRAALADIRQLNESPNSDMFFVKKVAFPMANFCIYQLKKMNKVDYLEKLKAKLDNALKEVKK